MAFNFDVAMLTNLSRDHLDYHGDMQSYAAAKRKLFDWQQLGFVVLNLDDAYGAELAEQLQDGDAPSPRILSRKRERRRTRRTTFNPGSDRLRFK